jgi:hypothetical protein
MLSVTVFSIAFVRFRKTRSNAEQDKTGNAKAHTTQAQYSFSRRRSPYKACADGFSDLQDVSSPNFSKASGNRVYIRAQPGDLHSIAAERATGQYRFGNYFQG